MFQKAARWKLRFESGKGLCPVEQLWDLPLPVLDKIAKALRAELQDSNLESFIAPLKTVDKVLELKFEIVKQVIAVRLEELKDAENAEVKRQKRVKILTLIEGKKDDALKDSSVEELTALLADL